MRRQNRCLQAILAVSVIYLIVLLYPLLTPTDLGSGEAIHATAAPATSLYQSYKPFPIVSSGLVYHPQLNASSYSKFDKSAARAWELGQKLFDELSYAPLPPRIPDKDPEVESCFSSISSRGEDLKERKGLMVLPCGLAVGSHITIVARPRQTPKEKQWLKLSQFFVELQGLNPVVDETPPKMFHFNAQLKEDFTGHPVIDHNTCYRLNWATPHRCNGSRSGTSDKTVDGLVQCEEWIPQEAKTRVPSKTRPLLNHLDDNSKKVQRYPFEEGKLFVLKLSAGKEGYHVSVDGRHVSSFPYHPRFALEEATGLMLYGDLDIQSVLAASLPMSHPSIFPEMLLELKSPPLPNDPVEIFIGIISAGNHFAERMAVRKTWMSSVRKSSNMVARFFVALHENNEVNIELKREAEFFGDIVFVPYIDNYDLLAFKTAAICEFGVNAVSAKYIMKCDDDTFVRVDTLVEGLVNFPNNRSVYVGNMNIHTRPMRTGKWAVTREEWHQWEYPAYANGPGYIISNDIARFIVSEFENQTLKLFKLEDVCMGLWVGEFNHSWVVEYIDSPMFCQYGCIEDYLTAHYQSPRQMMCLWDKLLAGNPQCCNPN